jgi:hypothetical protein
LEVDASDVDWGACAYQMLMAFEGDPKDEGRMLLLSIVENLYRQGGKMLFADPLSRVCGPTEGWFDPSLPGKLAALFEYLPDEVRNNVNVRVYAGKDTYAAGRLVQKWRKPTNPISKGKLLTKDLAQETFHIGDD